MSDLFLSEWPVVSVAELQEGYAEARVAGYALLTQEDLEGTEGGDAAVDLKDKPVDPGGRRG